MGRNPSGSAGTGQAKMGSQARRGRGVGGSALRLRGGGGGVLQPSPGAAPGSRSSAVYVWSNTPLTEITEAAPRPRKAVTTWQSRAPKLGAENKKCGRGSLLPSPSLHWSLPPWLQSICRSQDCFPWCISLCRRPPWKLHLSSGDILWDVIDFVYGAGSAGVE